MNQKRETDLREGLRFLLAKSGVSGFTRPDEFDLCGCCCCEAPRIDRLFSIYPPLSFTGKLRVFTVGIRALVYKAREQGTLEPYERIHQILD